MFITFEGPDGSGKTTQIKMLADYLTAKGHDVVLTREPGGTPTAEKLRTLLITRDGGDWTPLSEVLLLYTARHEHIDKKIKPALAAQKIVISDRFHDSTWAYQGYGHQMDHDAIQRIEDITLGGFQPDLTIILDIDVKKGLERTGVRFTQNEDNSANTEDRFERLPIEFHERLRTGFLNRAQADTKRCRVISADQAIENVHTSIISEVDNVLT